MRNNIQNKKIGKIKIPLIKAFQIAVKNIRVRFGRSIVTALGIVLGIAFYAAVQTGRFISSNVELDMATRIEQESRVTWLVIMSLLMCLVGIANSMLMSVTERYKEIGTMKCLGATDTFIVQIFVFESILLGVVASACGAFVGFISLYLVRIITEGGTVLARTNWQGVGMMFVWAISIGVILTSIAAIIPAIRAAKMPAAAALRTEI